MPQSCSERYREERSRRLELQRRVRTLERELRDEARMRDAAETNARNFHAMLLQERIGRIPERAG
jgi:hypothetical protein